MDACIFSESHLVRGKGYAMEDGFTIGILIKELGINKETIRYYEKIGLLSPSKRGKNGYRLYSKDDINNLWFIRIAKEFGFTLGEIKDLLITLYPALAGGNKESIRLVVQRKMEEVDTKIKALEKTKKLLHNVILQLETRDCLEIRY